MLSDNSIRECVERGEIEFAPYNADAVQPASVDVRLGRLFRVFRPEKAVMIDLGQPLADAVAGELVDVGENGSFILHRGEFALGHLAERLRVGSELMARVEGKSSLARVGLAIHSTAGFVDPGWNGHLTLEFTNVGPFPLCLRAGMKIGHISFERLTSAADRPYGTAGLGSKYQGDEEPGQSRYVAD